MPLYGPPSATLSGPTLGFFGAPPVPQPTGYTAGWVTSSRALASYAPDTQSSAFSGGLLDLLQAARLSDLNKVRVAYENLRVFTESAVQQHNQLVADLRSLGLIS